MMLALGLAGCAREAEPVCNGSLCDGPLDEGKYDGVVRRLPWGLAIELVGSEEAVLEGARDLERIAALAPGASLIAELEARASAAGERLVLRVREQPDDDLTQCARTLFTAGSFDHGRARAADWHVGEAGRIVVDTAGPGVAPSRIRLIVNRACQPTYPDGAPCAEPHVWMFHEMLHALHALDGVLLDAIADPSDPMQGGSNHEEALTIGRGSYRGEPRSENGLRALIGLPLRDSHGSMCGPRGDGDAGPGDAVPPDLAGEAPAG